MNHTRLRLLNRRIFIEEGAPDYWDIVRLADDREYADHLAESKNEKQRRTRTGNTTNSNQERRNERRER